MFTRCWNWNRGFKGDMAAQARNEAQLLRAMPEAASDAAWARGQISSPTSSASGFEAPTAAELQQWADEAIAGNLYEKIMEQRSCRSAGMVCWEVPLRHLVLVGACTF